MPGISTLISSNDSDKSRFKNNNLHLLHEDYMFIENIIDVSHIVSQAIVHSSYPYNQFTVDGDNIFILGKIYNFSDAEIVQKLKPILKAYSCDEDGFTFLLKQFLNDADGDFIIQAITKDQDYIIFNDLLGRLPLYYFNENDIFICSSEIKGVLLSKSKINVSMLSFLEFILYEYTFGDNTLYADVFKLKPGSLIIRAKHDCIIKSIVEINFTTTVDINKNIFLDECNTVLKKAVHSRVSSLTNDYLLKSDISGGLDSRTIAGILYKYPQIKYHTFEYVQDESKLAKEVLSSLNIDTHNNYIKYTFDNSFNFKDSSKFVFINDGLANYYSTSVCYKDLQHVKQLTKDNSVRFTGLGISDFIRKYPYEFIPFYNLSIDRNYRFGFLKNIVKLTELLNINEELFQERMRAHFSQYKEKDKGDFLKRVYFEFQWNYVSLAGEDRERIHFWSVPPMYSSRLMRKIGSEMKLKWAGYKFYIDFLNKVDPRLSGVKLYNRKISIRYASSLILYDKFLQFRSFINYLSDTNKIFNKLLLLIKRKKQSDTNELLLNISDLLKNNPSFNSLVPNGSYLTSLSEIELKRIITIMLFLEELSVNFNKKIVFIEQ
jgi:asparagine synthase (glutamine-hydrolysing)